MSDTLQGQRGEGRTSLFMTGTADRPDDRLRAGLGLAGVLPLDPRQRPRWIRKLKWGNLSLLPVVGVIRRRNPNPDASYNSRLASASRPAKEETHRRLAAYIFGVGVVLLIAGGGAFVALHLIGEPPDVSIGSPPNIVEPGELPPGSGPGTGDPSDDGGGEEATSPPTTRPGVTPTTQPNPNPPPTTVPPPPPPPPPPTPPPPPPPVDGPLLQLAAAVLAGVDATLAVGLGDGSCTGLRIGSLAIGCAPDSRTTVGATVDASGTLVPPIHVSIP